MAVPYTFGSATTSIPLSQLDSNFATTITLGNTAIQLGNTVTTLNNMTLGNVTVSSGNVVAGIASGTITQAMLGTNVAGNGPAFSAYLSSTQTVTTNVVTKVTLDTELFDTNNNFASSRFTPTVAGYYQINGGIQTLSAAQPALYIYKNGSNYAQNSIGTSLVNGSLQISTIVYCNGSTDYIELYAVSFGGTQFNGNQQSTYMSGSLVRSA